MPSSSEKHISASIAVAREGYALLRDHCVDDTLAGLVDALERTHVVALEQLGQVLELNKTIELCVLAAAERAGV